MSERPALNEAQMEALRHMLGLLGDSCCCRTVDRNHYAAEPSDPVMAELVALGLVYEGRPIVGGLRYFHASAKGQAVAMASLKPVSRSKSRYTAFLNLKECFPALTFTEFLQDTRFAPYRR
jgi:hypothetical protein